MSTAEPPAGPSPGGSAPPPGPPAPAGPPAKAERPGGLLSRVSSALVLYHDPRSPHAEQYRAFRTNLTALNRGGGPWAVVFTSSRQGEGKSITVANVAACLAELPGTRVCLLDVDFRRQAQGPLLGLDHQPGLTELLQDEANLQRVLRPTVVPGLDLLPAGDEPRNPAELLGGERLANLLSELKRRYSWILIDTPPVHPFTDACVLAPRTNGVVVVVRMEQTPRDLVQRSMQSIQRAGGRVLGSFLTGMATDRDDADRGGHYRLDREGEGQDAGQAAARRDAEKRLREQEQAWLRRQEDERRAAEREREPEV
jgi:capsular exopolysaccharide synthesis family protein